LIAIGDYRVAFDEHFGRPDLRLDPFQNTAGYVHLFCLEKFFDFPQLCKDYNVRADTRSFPFEPKSWAINRDVYAELGQVAENFIKNAQPCHRHKDYYKETLCYALTAENLRKEPHQRQVIRAERQGNSVDKHFNNLDVKAQNIGRIKAKKPLLAYERPAIEKREPRRKRKHVEDEDEDVSPRGSPIKKPKVTDHRQPAANEPRMTRRQAEAGSQTRLEKKPTKRTSRDKEGVGSELSSPKSPNCDDSGSNSDVVDSLPSPPPKSRKRKAFDREDKVEGTEEPRNLVSSWKRYGIHAPLKRPGVHDPTRPRRSNSI